MAKHKVHVTMPPRELNRADVKLEVNRDGKKFGTLLISNGSLVWFPRGTSCGCKMGWKEFDAIMDERAARTELR